MPNMDLTEIIIVLDRSGSMASIMTDTIGGYNTLINKQKTELGKAIVTTALFDNEYTLLYNGVDIEKVQTLDEGVYIPRGSTSLYDAVGRTIMDVSARISRTEEDERPGKVIMAIITDGQENTSKEFKGEQVAKLVEEKRTADWQILFIGADESSLKDAEKMGLTRSIKGRSMAPMYTMSSSITDNSSFTGGGITGQAMTTAYEAISGAVSSYRSTGEVGDWTSGNQEPTGSNEE